MTTSRPSRIVTAAVTCLVTLGGYLALLAWDQTKALGADGSLHGPYDTWQVTGLCIVVAAAAVWAGLRGNPVIGAVAASVTLTVAFSIDAATDSDSDGLWPVGAALLAMGTLLGVAAVAFVVAEVRRGTRGQLG